MESWLKCDVAAGQFDSEAAVRGKDHAGEAFSLFVPRDAVRVHELANDWREGSVRVEILDSRDHFHLVYLPGPTFGNGPSITVRDSQLQNSISASHV